MAAKRKKPFSPLDIYSEKFQWNRFDKSTEVILHRDCLVAQFHPSWSNGTAGIRGNKAINARPSRFYWEVLVKDRVFGTSMMFGISTRSAQLHSDSFINLIGENEFGWGLSHKGLIWHNSRWKMYTKPFRENKTTRIGCFYDGFKGTLTFFKDGVSLGVAFTGLDQVKESLYPTVSSTAAKTQFQLIFAEQEFHNLQERCRYVILKELSEDNLKQYCLPESTMKFLRMEDEEKDMCTASLQECDIKTETKTLLSHKKAFWPAISLTEHGFQRNKIPMPDL